MDLGGTHIVQQLLQALLELVEVAGCDEALAALLQTVSGQFDQLMVDEAQDAVGQRTHLLQVGGGHQLRQTLLHLSRSLEVEEPFKILHQHHHILLLLSEAGHQ